MNEAEKFKAVLNRYKNGKCTIAELEWLYHQLKSDPPAGLAEELIVDELLQEIPVAIEQAPEMQQKLHRLYQNIAERSIYSEASLKPARKWRWSAWYNVAAILLIGLTTVFYLYKVQTGADTLTKMAAKIEPGTNKATLTLANGQAITLNSNQEVVMMNDNKLEYADGSEILPQGTETDHYVITTPKGGQYQIVLADGTRVWLNAASTLKYQSAFTGEKRIVEFEGEGYFEVQASTRNGKRVPFIVKTAQQEIEVLGTHFNVNAYKDEQLVKTTLLEGSVRVQDPALPQNGVILKPGQQAELADLPGHTQIHVREIDAASAVAWKNGYFKFEEADIYTVMRQLSRWYDIEVEFAASVPKVNFTGKIKRNESLNKVLDQLSYFGLDFSLKDRVIKVSPK